MKAVLSIVSPEYENIYKICAESLNRYLPDWDHIKVSTNDLCVQSLRSKYPYADPTQFICAIRPEIVCHYLHLYDDILFIGADVVFFDRPGLFKWDN
jgi:hypothetical protein